MCQICFDAVTGLRAYIRHVLKRKRARSLKIRFFCRHVSCIMSYWVQISLHMPKISSSVRQHFFEAVKNIHRTRLKAALIYFIWPLGASWKHWHYHLIKLLNVNVLQMLSCTSTEQHQHSLRSTSDVHLTLLDFTSLIRKKKRWDDVQQRENAFK